MIDMVNGQGWSQRDVPTRFQNSSWTRLLRPKIPPKSKPACTPSHRGTGNKFLHQRTTGFAHFPVAVIASYTVRATPAQTSRLRFS